jgi:hypothetical protein
VLLATDTQNWNSLVFDPESLSPPANEDSSSLHKRACELVERARLSPDSSPIFLQAARVHRLAAEVLRREIGQMPDGDVKIIALALLPYYLYEAFRSERVFHYEARNTEAALTAGTEGEEQLLQAIDRAKEAAAKVSPPLREKAIGFVADFEFRKSSDDAALAAVHARKAWDDGDVLKARDWYQRSAHLLAATIDRAKGLPDPQYYRIAVGNQIAAAANEANALARHFVDEGRRSPQSKQVFMLALKSLLDAYSNGLQALRANPQWPQYRDGSQSSRDAMRSMLAMNPWIWKDVLLEFPSQPVIVALMHEIDPRRAATAEGKEGVDRIVALWRVGGFYILLFLVVAAVALSFASVLRWWAAILAVIFAESVLLFIGALTLRTTGDLTETGFLKLIEMAMKSQFRVLGRVLDSKERPSSRDPED